MRLMPTILVLCWGLLLSAAPALRAARLPVEPERDNSEYVLDSASNTYTREWRELWDATDNALRFRVGSNNVEHWNLEEELKLSTRLLSRLRLRFYHARLLNYSSHKRSFNTIEFEGAISQRYYLSLFVTPTAEKTNNSLGLMIQRRTAVDRYVCLFIEFPRLLNNFTEHRKENGDTLLSLYSRQPIKIGSDLRERVGDHITVRLSGYVTNTFAFVTENDRTGVRTDEDTGWVRAVSGWIDYCADREREVRSQAAAGVSGAVYAANRDRTMIAAQSQPAVGRKLIPPCRHSMGDLPFIDFDAEPFTVLDEDSIGAFEERVWFVQPYVWLPATDAIVFRASLRFEHRRIEWMTADTRRTKLKNFYIAPSAGVRIGLGERRQSVIEGGLAASFRNREEIIHDSLGAYRMTSEDLSDSRIYLAYEYHFRPDAVVRIVESIDLDREDWGQFSIHDHGFFQIIVGF